METKRKSRGKVKKGIAIINALLFFGILVCMYVSMYVCIYMCSCVCVFAAFRSRPQPCLERDGIVNITRESFIVYTLSMGQIVTALGQGRSRDLSCFIVG